LQFAILDLDVSFEAPMAMMFQVGARSTNRISPVWAYIYVVFSCLGHFTLKMEAAWTYNTGILSSTTLHGVTTQKTWTWMFLPFSCCNYVWWYGI